MFLPMKSSAGDLLHHGSEVALYDRSAMNGSSVLFRRLLCLDSLNRSLCLPITRGIVGAARGVPELVALCKVRKFSQCELWIIVSPKGLGEGGDAMPGKHGLKGVDD